MGLSVQKRSWKNSDGSVTESWRLIIEEFSSGKRKVIYPSRDKYRFYGIEPDDKFEVAKEKLKATQARNKLERLAERRARIDARLAREDLIESAYLPRQLWSEYLVWLQQRRLWDKIDRHMDAVLRAMRRLIRDVNAPPSEWSDKPQLVYLWFKQQKLSLSYIDKMLPLLNDYGFFYCRTMKAAFLPIPSVRGQLALRIDETNQDARDGRQAPSKPLKRSQLEKLAAFAPDQRLWVELSFFFGLRPMEVDRLTEKHRDKYWALKQDPKGLTFLAVFQTKGARIERERRWKRIPCILREQKALAKSLDEGVKIRRPLAKSIHLHIGEGYGLYMGRKGFDPLMREHGQKFENVSRWLGHADVKRTERNYREIEAVEYDPVPRS